MNSTKANDIPLQPSTEASAAFFVKSKPEFAGCGNHAIDDADAVIYGIPTDCGAGSNRFGASTGPSEIRSASNTWNTVRTSQGYQYPNCGNVVDLGDIRLDHLEKDKLLEAIVPAIPSYAPDRLTMMLGGDHSVTIPVLKSLDRAWGMIYMDAHPDVIEALHGDHNSHACTLKRLIESGKVIPEHTVLIGMRLPEAEEVDFIKKHNLTVFTAYDVLEMGIRQVVDRTLDILGDAPAYLSLDMDVMDASGVPGVENPEPGGLSSREVLYACMKFAGHIEACDIVEVTDQYDPAKITATAAARIGIDIIGNYIAHKRSAE